MNELCYNDFSSNQRPFKFFWLSSTPAFHTSTNHNAWKCCIVIVRTYGEPEKLKWSRLYIKILIYLPICFCVFLENEEPHHHQMCVTVHSVCCCGFELKRGATVFAIIWAVLCLTIACLQLGLTGM